MIARTAAWAAALIAAVAVARPVGPARADGLGDLDDLDGGAPPAIPDDARPITLADAIAGARAHNPGYQAAVARHDAARARVGAAAGVDDLVIEASATGLTRAASPVAGAFLDETAVDAIGARVGLWQPLPWGGRVGLEVGDDVVRSTARIAIGGPVDDRTSTIHQPRAELVWQQPLLRDRGRAHHGAARALAAAGADLEDAARRGAETTLVLDVARAYWELAYAERAVAIRVSALARARDQLAVTQARAAVGKVSELEVATAQQAIAAGEAAWLAAAQDRAARAVDLRVLLGDDGAAGRPLTAADPLTDAGAAPATADAVARALAFAPGLRALGHQARAAAIEVDVAAADLRPRLDLIVRGGPSGHADDAGAAWAQLGRFDGYQASAALAFAFPVGNRLARGQRDAARAEQRRVELEGAALEGAITAATIRAVDAVALSDRRITAAAAAVALARRTAELERDRWRAGAGTNLDVVIRQDQAVAAEVALARAQVDRRLALAALAALTGP